MEEETVDEDSVERHQQLVRERAAAAVRSPLGSLDSLAINSAPREKSSRERDDDGALLRGVPKRAREGGIE